MTTDPKDAEIARLTAELFKMTRSRDEWRNDFRALEKAIVGDTGLSAMTVAAQARLFRPRAEKAEAERDAALAQVATAITGNKSGTICRDCRGVGMIHCSDPFNCGGMQPYTVEELKSALSRRDAQMRAEGMRKAAKIAYDVAHYTDDIRKPRDAILAAAEKEEK